MAHDIVWKVSDNENAKRLLTLLYAKHPDPDFAASYILKLFTDQLSQYPFQWPVQNEPERLEDWRWGKLQIQYRRDPANHLVEIMSVKELTQPISGNES